MVWVSTTRKCDRLQWITGAWIKFYRCSRGGGDQQLSGSFERRDLSSSGEHAEENLTRKRYKTKRRRNSTGLGSLSTFHALLRLLIKKGEASRRGRSPVQGAQ
jgi:hypothetical protein